ncbi:MAG: hypothetical protein ACKVQJ_12845 [Pyrinomonadaceae bacterium]
MNDTSPEIEHKQFEMMMSLGSERRLELACEMYMAARSHIFNSLPADMTGPARKRAFVDKMYGKEFAGELFNDEDK